MVSRLRVVHVCPPFRTQPSVSMQKKQNLRGVAEESFLLLVMVLSTLKGKERRDAIRQTWAKEGQEASKEEKDVLIKFVIGTKGMSTQEMEGVG